MAETDERVAPTDESGPLPEFRIVVRRPNEAGPLGPYRLPIAVAVVVVVFGSALWNSIAAGMPDDGLLIRAGILGLLVWITTGIVSAALGSAGAAAQRQRPSGPST